MTALRPSATAGREPAEPARIVIDDEHLRRMTLGDRGLEREVLEIFMRQAALMLRRIAGAKPALPQLRPTPARVPRAGSVPGGWRKRLTG